MWKSRIPATRQHRKMKRRKKLEKSFMRRMKGGREWKKNDRRVPYEKIIAYKREIDDSKNSSGCSQRATTSENSAANKKTLPIQWICVSRRTRLNKLVANVYNAKVIRLYPKKKSQTGGIPRSNFTLNDLVLREISSELETKFLGTQI